MKRSLATGKLAEILAELTPDEHLQLDQDWPGLWARDEQSPPGGDGWRSWLILGGRGGGKTRAGVEWVKAMAIGLGTEAGPRARRIALVAPNFDEARLVMIEGVSGLLAVHEASWRPAFEPSKRSLTWPNGAVAQVFSAEEPDGLRGPQFDAAWCDELAKWKHGERAWNMLMVGMGGYVGGRSLEKVAGMVMGGGSIQGGSSKRGKVRG